MTLRVGTRASDLALAQAHAVADRLEDLGHEPELVEVSSRGDETRSIPIHRIGVAGAFTARLEAALADGTVDLAVHSLKDLPLEAADGLELAAVLPRGTPEDALLVAPAAHVGDRDPPLVEGARVATSGPRRRSQLLAAREDLVPVDVRGNVDTRLAKLRERRFDALVMAAVALDRAPLDTDGVRVHRLDPARFPPAPGQAAIAVQARAASAPAEAARALDDPDTRAAVEAERRVLGALGGGCGLPLGAWARREDGRWHLDATFAGHAWTPAHEPTLDRAAAQDQAPQAPAERAAKRFEATQARRAPPAEEAPEGPPVLVVASRPTAKRWAAQLRAAGVAALPAPTRTFAPAAPPTGDARERLLDADWLVATSRQAVDPLVELTGSDPPDAYGATVGPATAAAMQAAGLPAHLVAPEATGASLARELARLADAGDAVLLAQGDTAREDVRERLDEAGLDVRAWTAYHTEPEPDPLEGLGEALPARAALVMSPRNADALPLDTPDAVAERFLAVGPTTAEHLRERGLDPAVLDRPTPDAALEALP